jgi:Iap family predicted aminopeptidase
LENLWKKIFIASILIFVLCLTVFLQQTQKTKISTVEEIKTDVELVPCKDKERLEAVKKLFVKMGADEKDLIVEDLKTVENLVVTKKGKTAETVIIGAHYDKTDEGCGVIDNWTGIVIIANLYRTMKDFPTEKTYKFVAFGKEEKGLLGSNAMAKAIARDDLKNYCAMVNLDSFGFSYPQVLENVSSPKMTVLAKDLAKELEMPFTTASINSALADSASFKSKEIPAITFHGLSNDWGKYLHTSNDKLENVNIDSVLVGYQFMIRYLVKLDSSACNSFR